MLHPDTMRDAEAEIGRITAELGNRFQASGDKDDLIKCLTEAYTDTMLLTLHILESEAPSIGCRNHAGNYAMYLSLSKAFNDYNGT